MEGVKPWHVVLIVAAVLVLSGSVLWQCSHSEKVEISDTIVVVDVVSGDLYESALPKKMVVFPAVNPSSGTKTLLPAYTKDGKWYLAANYRPMVKDVVAGGKSVADPNSGELTVKTSKPESKKIF